MRLTDREKAYFDRLTNRLLARPEFGQMAGYTQHGSTSCLQHSLAVAYYSYWLCRRLHINVSYKGLIRGALLHDFFLYDWHDKDPSHRLHGFFHPKRALDNASALFELSQAERRIIKSHMWPLTLRSLPTCRAAVIVCLMDKFCSSIEVCRLQRHFYIYRRYDHLRRRASQEKEPALCQT